MTDVAPAAPSNPPPDALAAARQILTSEPTFANMTHIIQTLASAVVSQGEQLAAAAEKEAARAASEAAAQAARVKESEELQTALKRVAELEDRVRVLDGKTQSRRPSVVAREGAAAAAAASAAASAAADSERESVLGPLQAAVDECRAAAEAGAAAIASLQADVSAVVEMVTVAPADAAAVPLAERASRVALLEGGLAALQEETTKALANKAEKRIEKMTEKVFEDVQMLERNEAQLREHTKALEDDYAAGAAQRDALGAFMAQERALRQESQASVDEIRAEIERALAVKADRPELAVVSDALRDLRGAILGGAGVAAGGRGGGGGGVGGGGASIESVEALSAGQQQTAQQVLSLQSHVRALLRKAETQGAAATAGVEPEQLHDLRKEVHRALSELNGRVLAMGAEKADTEKVETALELKADKASVAHKADRSFCEALLSRFSTEVGRQLGAMEEAHTQLQAALADQGARGGGPVGGAASAARVRMPGTTLADGADGGGGGSASEPQLGKGSRGASPPTSGRAGSPERAAGGARPRAQQGVLPTSVFRTGGGDAAEPDAHRYAFQPRRTTLLTPGEQQLAPLAPRTRHPPPRPGSSGAAVRQLPTRSASAAALVAH